MTMGTVEDTYLLEGKIVEVLEKFNDLRIVETGEWVNNLIVPGDLIKIIQIDIYCDTSYPGCYPSKISFIPIDWPELGLFEGKIYRPNQSFKVVRNIDGEMTLQEWLGRAEKDCEETFERDWIKVIDTPSKELIELANNYLYAAEADDGSVSRHWNNFLEAGGNNNLLLLMKKIYLLDPRYLDHVL